MKFNTWYYSKGFGSYYFVLPIKNGNQYYGWSLQDYSIHQQLNLIDHMYPDMDGIVEQTVSLNLDTKIKMISELFGRIK